MKAHFSKIQRLIADHISASKESIEVAVAWFVNKELLSYLSEKASNGLDVKVLVSDDVINKKLDFTKAQKKGVQLQLISGERFLHEKFALFDKTKLITGSYNWTYGAEYWNHESVIESSEPLLMKQYSIRFKNLWSLASEFQSEMIQIENAPGFLKQEDDFKKLESELEKEILETLEALMKLKVPISKTIVLDMIHNYGAIGACRKVLEKGNDDQNIPSGFIKLVEANRMDQSFEYLMTREKYRVLFPDNVLNDAEERLKKFSR